MRRWPRSSGIVVCHLSAPSPSRRGTVTSLGLVWEPVVRNGGGAEVVPATAVLMLVGFLTVRRQGGTGDSRSGQDGDRGGRQEGAGRRARRRAQGERAVAGPATDGGRGLRVD